ncbi:MAG: protein-export chaperone SecB [Gammaproteobacteria bacterium]|jgi:preprotein translocase subunit SecB|nr:protein-export chaperone SecB [Gammaproteobacteria bacterium]
MAEQSNPTGQKQFSIQKIYVKDMSFETPNSPAVFTQDWKPEINLELNSKATSVAEGMHEVVLSLTVTAKLGDTTAYLAEVQQAGIFAMIGFSQEETAPMLGAFCPGTLYPYAREAVSDLVARGGFPQLVLAPINFDALYAQQIQKVQAQVVDPAQAQH